MARTCASRPDAAHLSAGSDSDDARRWWAAGIDERRHSGHRALTYFDDDDGADAVRNARRLAQLSTR